MRSYTSPSSCRPDAPWSYYSAFAPDSSERLLGDKENCPELCQKFLDTYKKLLDERDPAKRTALNLSLIHI